LNSPPSFEDSKTEILVPWR